MKLVYITNSRIPTEKAHGWQICKMCEEFAKLGIEVELWLPTRVNNFKEDVYTFYGIENNFKIIRIPSFDFFKYWKILGKLSFWLQSFWFAVKLLFIKVDKNAIVYTRDAEISWVFSLRGYPTFIEAHNWPAKDRLYEFLIRRNKGIIAISNGLKHIFLKSGRPENQVIVAPDGVDLKKFDLDLTKEQARIKLNLPKDKKIIIYTGHLYQWKGAQDLAESAVNFSKNDILIIFVGGVETDIINFRKKNEKLIKDNKIMISGYQKHSLIPTWLKAADVLVISNKGEEKISKIYTSPLKLFEYMASKRPVVASDLPSLKEIMNEKNCVFFQPGNTKDLAEKINFLLENKVISEKISEQAFIDVKEYTWEKRAKKIIDFIIKTKL